MTDIDTHPAVVTALLAARAALECDADPQDEERALKLLATAGVAPASDAHRILLARARQAIITWQAGEEADRHVAPDIDAALVRLGFEAQFEEYDRETWDVSAGPIAGWTHTTRRSTSSLLAPRSSAGSWIRGVLRVRAASMPADRQQFAREPQRLHPALPALRRAIKSGRGRTAHHQRWTRPPRPQPTPDQGQRIHPRRWHRRAWPPPPPPMSAQPARALAERRQQQGLSQQALARRLGLTQAQVSRTNIRPTRSSQPPGTISRRSATDSSSPPPAAATRSRSNSTVTVSSAASRDARWRTVAAWARNRPASPTWRSSTAPARYIPRRSAPRGSAYVLPGASHERCPRRARPRAVAGDLRLGCP